MTELQNTVTKGVFTVSLDFELAWGFLDWPDLEPYEPNLRGVRQVVPSILEHLERHRVHATWATVGFLMHADRKELLQRAPGIRPTYDDPALDPYRFAAEVDDLDPDLHFAPDLVDMIRAVPGQEIGSHTHCHYYGLEPGQNREQFAADLEAIRSLAASRGLALSSLVFPRNQSNPAYLDLLTEAGVRCFRGNESSRLYRAAKGTEQKLWMRGARLLDAYLPLTGDGAHDLNKLACQQPYSIPASRFLRPHPPRGAVLEPLRLHRITAAMTQAARTGRLFHLWWHPHNFGRQTEQNLEFLGRILRHYDALESEYGMRSLSMSEVADVLDTIRQRRIS